MSNEISISGPSNAVAPNLFTMLGNLISPEAHHNKSISFTSNASAIDFNNNVNKDQSNVGFESDVEIEDADNSFKNVL